MSAKKRLLGCLVSTLVMLCYLCIGSVVFVAVEQPNWEQNKTPAINGLQEILAKIDRLREKLNSTDTVVFEDDEYHSNMSNNKSRNASSSVSSLLDETQRITYQLLLSEYQASFPWNFYTGIHFCLTAITTIGYGYISPVTQLGRALCIPYILIGLPINFFFSVKTGYFVAQFICKLYDLSIAVVRFLLLGVTKRRRDDTQHGGKTFRKQMNSKLDNEKVNVPNNRCDFEITSVAGNDLFKSEAEETGVTTENYFSASKDVNESEDSPGNVHYVKNEPSETNHEPSSSKGNGSIHTESSDEDDSDIIPLWFMLLMLVSLWLVVAAITYVTEMGNWTFLDSLYFITVTFTTVGFGDVTFNVTRMFESDYHIIWLIVYSSVLMQFGLLLTAAFITLWSERVDKKMKVAKKKIEKRISTRSLSTT